MNSERNIVKKLFENKYEELEEAGFDDGGNHYSCAFGKYYKNGEEINRKEYFKAKGDTSAPKSSPSRKGNEISKVTASDSPDIDKYKKSSAVNKDLRGAVVEDLDNEISKYTDLFTSLDLHPIDTGVFNTGPTYEVKKYLSDDDVQSIIDKFTEEGYTTEDTSSEDTVTMKHESGHEVQVRRSGSQSDGSSRIYIEGYNTELMGKYQEYQDKFKRSKKAFLSKVDWGSVKFNNNVDGMSREDLEAKFSGDDYPVAKILVKGTSMVVPSNYLIHPDGTIVKAMYNEVNPICGNSLRKVSDVEVQEVKKKMIDGKYKVW